MGNFDWVPKFFGARGETNFQLTHHTPNKASFADRDVYRDLEERFEKTGPGLRAEAEAWELTKTQSLTNCEYPEHSLLP